MKKYFFIPFIILCVACSSETGKLMQSARDFEAKKKPQEALKIYEKIVKESPGSHDAPEAMFHCAALYRSLNNDLIKSASTYESIAENYPKSTYGHQGLFASAFMYANEMNNQAKAKTLYERYLSTYPDSSLAKMVKFELKNLGKSPDDILKSLQDSSAAKTEPVAGK
jgi:TolA-binding protein